MSSTATYRGQVAGWKPSRRSEEAPPLLDNVPLYRSGRLGVRHSPRAGRIFSIDGEDVDTATVRANTAEIAGGWRQPDPTERADRPWARLLRMTQGRYRRERLGLPPGLHRSRTGSRPVASRLPAWAVAEDPTLNFLADDRIYEQVLERLAEEHASGIVEPYRLHHDLLSSQPLCFNLFALPAQLDGKRLARALADTLNLDVTKITALRFEHRPPIDDGYSTGSAFDCFVEYEGLAGQGLLGIETKYSEHLARQRPSTNLDYARFTARTGSGWRDGAAGRLNEPSTCQLWYNAVLTQRTRDAHGHAAATTVLIACERDRPAFEAVQRVADEAPFDTVRWCSYEQLVSALGGQPVTQLLGPALRPAVSQL